MKKKIENLILPIIAVAAVLLCGIFIFVNPGILASLREALQAAYQRNGDQLAAILSLQNPNERIFFGLIDLISILAPVFSPEFLQQASIAAFGEFAGKSMIILCGVISVFITYGIGSGLRGLFSRMKPIQKLLEKLPEMKGTVEIIILVVAFNVFMIHIPFISGLLYVIGFLRVDFKKILLLTGVALFLI